MEKYNLCDYVKVKSGGKMFFGKIDEIDWDFDQWIYKINGEWYYQSEVTQVKSLGAITEVDIAKDFIDELLIDEEDVYLGQVTEDILLKWFIEIGRRNRACLI